MKRSIPFFSLDKIHSEQRESLLLRFRKKLDENWFILGKDLELFESMYADYTGVRYSIGVGNGYDALRISLESLGLKKNDEVVVPSHTFIASVLAVVHAGLKPVLADVNPDTYNLDLKQIDKVHTARTRVIIPVHMYGNPCPMDDIMDFSNISGLQVVEDNAQSVGAACINKKTGSFGTINASSFYPVKGLGALGDGGVITTNSYELAEYCRELRNYGLSGKYKMVRRGFNSRLDELQAAFLQVKLPFIDKWIEERRIIAARYIANFSGIKKIILPVIEEKAEPVYHIFPIRVNNRNQLQQYLKNAGIGTQVHYPIPLHLQPGFKNLGYKKGDFPNTEKISGTVLSLPVYPGLNDDDVDYVSEKIIKFTRMN